MCAPLDSRAGLIWAWQGRVHVEGETGAQRKKCVVLSSIQGSSKMDDVFFPCSTMSAALSLHSSSPLSLSLSLSLRKAGKSKRGSEFS